MEAVKQNVGIEVDKDKLKVCLKFLYPDQSSKIKGTRQFTNNASGFDKLDTWLSKKRMPEKVMHLSMEATGVYSENVSYHFAAKETYEVHVLLPNMSKAFFKSYNIKSKTDEIDAQALAQMGLERQLTPWQTGSPQMRFLRKLVRQRLGLQKDKTAVSNQLHAETSSYEPEAIIIQRYEAHLKLIETQIAQIEKELKEEVKKDEELQAKVDNVCQAPGIGFITAISVIAEMLGFIFFENRNQVMSYNGYDVVKNESGSSVRGKSRISKKGNSNVRRILYMPAMSAAQHDEHHKAYYQRIVEKTGIPMKANVAIQRKLLLLIFALFRDDNPYEEKHHEKVKARIEGKKNSEKQKAEQECLS